jgi:hypothetical protein
LIHGGGNIQGTVHLLNQPYWEVSNLEVTNNRSDGVRDYLVGIKAHNNTGGRLDGITRTSWNRQPNSST